MTPVLPGRFTDVTVRASEGAAAVEALDGTRTVVAVVLAPTHGAAIDVAVALERANRYALGVAGLELAREALAFDGQCALVYERTSQAGETTLEQLAAAGCSRERAVEILRAVARPL